MNNLKSLFLIGSFLLITASCLENNTFLSDEMKSINPYEVGQQLIFVSTYEVQDTLKITKVEDGRFPDGIGSPDNEHLIVNAFRRSRTDRNGTEERILTLIAKTDKTAEKIDFSISLKETALVMKYVSLKEYSDLEALPLKTKYESYDDILVFENRPDRRIHDRAVVEFWWSKSKGYVRLIQKDGVIWDLKLIE